MLIWVKAPAIKKSRNMIVTGTSGKGFGKPPGNAPSAGSCTFSIVVSAPSWVICGEFVGDAAAAPTVFRKVATWVDCVSPGKAAGNNGVEAASIIEELVGIVAGTDGTVTVVVTVIISDVLNEATAVGEAASVMAADVLAVGSIKVMAAGVLVGDDKLVIAVGALDDSGDVPNRIPAIDESGLPFRSSSAADDAAIDSAACRALSFAGSLFVMDVHCTDATADLQVRVSNSQRLRVTIARLMLASQLFENE
jgi:hypothetical protein